MTAKPRQRRRRRAARRALRSPLRSGVPGDAPSEISPALETNIAPDLIDTYGPLDRSEAVDAECHLVEKPAKITTPD